MSELAAKECAFRLSEEARILETGALSEAGGGTSELGATGSLSLSGIIVIHLASLTGGVSASPFKMSALCSQTSTRLRALLHPASD